MIIDHNNLTAEALPMYPLAADTYAQLAAAFEKFEEMAFVIDPDGDIGFAPYPGDVAVAFERYAKHMRTVSQYAADGRLELAAAIDAKYGDSHKEYLDIQMGEFVDAYHELAHGSAAKRSPLDGGPAAEPALF